ncbi:Calcineurin-like phosphoesterase [Prosthecobacter debontii]|uniref:Calcineurin-like phosphoesterase n=1 Tax=Prosthecobacter debontii TaxID=48467 RepID=A0A1T4YJB0_9BACT|nr:Ig-like domain-containing protein [Prosthecobacter debontii]SKB01648.1 Calcineurin-like phosphoesterase [Prosthecobacter debontii]
MIRSLRHPLALLFTLAPGLLCAQTLQFGNLQVRQNSTAGTTAAITLSIGPGSSSGFTLGASSTRGSYDVLFGQTNDLTSGVVISNVIENGRDNSGAAGGEAFDLFYATTITGSPNTAGSAENYKIGVYRAAQGDKVNMNVGFGYFPFSRYLGGIARNSVNNSALNSIIASPGIELGTGLEFQNTATNGTYILDLTSLGASSANGVLFVTGGKDEDNYALSQANADGTFNIICHDNGANGSGGETDGVAFVYLPISGAGSNNLVALGRVNSNATTDVAGGSYTLSKGGTGQWYLTIPGHDGSSGVLLVSAEGGTSYNADNIVSSQWDATNSRWVIESRDLSGATALPTLQNGGDNAEDMFSFAFFTTAPINVVPTVTLTAPTNASTSVYGTDIVLRADAADSDGTVARVEFYDGATLLGQDETAPYEWTLSAPAIGAHVLTARAVDSSEGSATSTAINVTVIPQAGTEGLFFDGVNDYVTFGNTPALGLASFTLECWFRRDGAGVAASTGSGGVSAIPLVTKGRGESDGSNVDCNYFLGIRADSGVLTADFEDMATGLNHPVSGTTPVQTGQWQHAAVTFDSTAKEWRLYLNGALEAVLETDGQVPRSDSIQHAGLATAMTSTGAAAGYFLGAMDEARIWNYARTQSEIQASINEQIPSATGLVGRWGMNEGTGTTITSTASGALTGTLRNDPLWTTGAPFSVNIPPSVSITAPADESAVFAPGAFTITATASDDDGSITQVEFLRNGDVVATDTAAPFELEQSGLPAGRYTYTARATDDRDAVAVSGAVSVRVVFDPANPPTNTALWFDGVDDYVTMGVAPELNVGGPPSNGFTAECWFRKEGAGLTSGSGSGGVTGVPLFGKGRGENDGSNVDCNYFFGINTAGQLVADFEAYPASGISSGLNFPVTGSHAAIQEGSWHHAAVTYDGNAHQWKLYLDGVEVGTASAATGALPRYDSIQHFALGAAMNSSGVREGAFAGRLDEVRVWNYARSPEEIAAAKDYEIASAVGLVGRYGLNEATGNNAGNSVSSTPVGVLTNGPVWVEGAPFSGVNHAPVISLTAPGDGASSMYPYGVNMTADAVDSDGGVVRVDFLVNGEKVGEDTEAPFTYVWVPPAVGTYELTARAVDTLGAAASSAVVNLTIIPNPNQAPSISLSAPADQASGIGGSTELTATLSDPEGDAMTVTFYGRLTTPTTPGPDFSLMTLPDTQYYSQNTGGTRLAQFIGQTNWIVSQKDTLKVAFVSHQGDIVENGESVPQQWVNADQALSILEVPATTLRAHGIPWGAAPGNHDQTPIGNADGSTVSFNQYFGVERFTGRSYYGGNYGVNNDNNYQLFSASGLDFIIIHIEYDTTPDQPVLDWADALLKAHPHRRGIITSHWMVNTGNPATFSAMGQALYDNLKDNPNLFLMLGGHIHGEGQRSDTFEGRTVHSVLQDYQGRSNGGDGWLRYFVFSPANNTITAKTYSPKLDQYETDTNSEFVLTYDMQAPMMEWVPLGTVTVPAGETTASLEWTGLESGKDYEWYAAVTDGISRVGSTTRHFSTAAGAAPTVQLTSPAEGALLSTVAPVTLTATAADSDGSIARVEFYQGHQKLGEDSTAPYTYVWSGAAVGSYQLSAVAVDDSGNTALSAIVNVTLTDANVPPTVNLTSPVEAAVYQAPAGVIFQVEAEDVDGSVTKVEFYQGATKVGEVTSAPYAFIWEVAAAGEYELTAVATDDDAATTVSEAVTVTVSAPVPAFTYTQDFNGLGTAGTTPPTGWAIYGNMGGTNSTWTNTTGIPVSEMGAGSVSTTLSATTSYTGTSNSNGYNYALSGSTSDRALGLSPTSGRGSALQLTLQNTTGADIPYFRIGYDMRRFTTASTANELPGYWLFYSLDDGVTWVSVSDLNPAASGATVNVPNSTGVTTVPLTMIQLGQPWKAGQGIRLRWVDDNATQTSPDQVYGLDNVTLTTEGLNALPTVLLTAPQSGASFSLPGPVTLSALASDGDGSVAKVEFFANGSKVGEDTSAPFTTDWAGMVSGTYELTVQATDDQGGVSTSAPVTVSIINSSNQSPTVAFVSPLANELIRASEAQLQVSVSDSDGTVTQVEFYRNGSKIGESTVAPFSFTWTGISVGEHTLTAVAWDNDGGSTTSTPITVTATAFTDVTTLAKGSVWKYLDDGSDQGTAWKESAFNDAAWASGPAKLGYQDNAVTVLREGPSGMTSSTKYITYYFRRTFEVADVSHVLGLQVNLLRDDAAVIYLNGVEVGRSNMPQGSFNYLTESSTIVSGSDETTYFPLTLPKAALVNGQNVIAVEIHQRDSASSDLGFDLELISTMAGGNALPVVQLTAPTEGATFFPGATVTLTATAEDSDGSVAKVEFYNGSTKLGEDSTAPYEYVWNGITAGSYAVKAIATDDIGSTGSSAVVNFTVTPGPSGTITRGPYLQQGTPSSMIVRWRSSQSVTGRVRYGTAPDALTQFVDEASAETEHTVKISGLNPYTRYYYSVGSADDVLAGGDAQHTFLTSPAANTEVTTRVWVLGDAGTADSNQRAVRDAFYTWTGSRTPDFWVMLGDNAYNNGTQTEFQNALFNIYPTMLNKSPLWSCIGNHETYGGTEANGRYPYENIHEFPTNGEAGGVASGTEKYFSWDYGHTHFISLDSMTVSRAANGAMATWLREDLAATTKTWIIVIFHHPPYTKGSHNSDSESELIQMRQNIQPILEEGGVDLVLCGHSHSYERSYLIDGHYGLSGTYSHATHRKQAGNGRPGSDGAYIKPLTGPRDHFGTVYAVAGSSGKISGGSLNHPAMYLSLNNLGSLVLDIQGNRLDATFIRENGSTPDSFTILKQGAADSDQDGISDEYEIAHGLDRKDAGDALLDSDKDGLTNLEEYLFGLKSEVSDRYMWSTTQDEVTGNHTVCFATLPGRSYQVFYSPDLVQWFPASGVVTGDGTEKCWTDDGSGGTPSASSLADHRFYRVKVTLTP